MKSVGCGNVAVVTFRPSKEINSIIKRLVKQGKAKNKSDAVNKLLLKEASSSMEEMKATGIIIQCPMRPVSFPPTNPYLKINLSVDSSVCKTCQSNPCDAWKDVKTWDVISPATKITTP